MNNVGPIILTQSISIPWLEEMEKKKQTGSMAAGSHFVNMKETCVRLKVMQATNRGQAQRTCSHREVIDITEPQKQPTLSPSYLWTYYY